MIFNTQQTTLKVHISEAEERDPRFDQVHYRFAVPENKAGVLVGRVELKPRKLRVNALMRYNIVNTEMRTLFNITPVSKKILAFFILLVNTLIHTQIRYKHVVFEHSIAITTETSLKHEKKNLK